MSIFITQDIESTLSKNFKYILFGKWKINYDQKEGYHFDSYQGDNYLLFLYGSIYDDTYKKPIAIYETISKFGDNALYEIDGEFIFGILTQKDVILYSDREGLIPIYYSLDKSLKITSEIYTLFNNFEETDIDYSAINDFLRFGLLIGNKTFSTKAKLLEYGSKLKFTNGDIVVDRIKLFYLESNENCDEDVLIKNLVKTYQEAIAKRLREDGQQTNVFLSGGIDSRFLLASLNQISPKKIKTVSFGQPNSEETYIARLCAEVKKNKFKCEILTPEHFIKNAEEYIRLTCGMDMFPQSYILDIGKNLDCKQFYTGFAMDVYLGGTFINNEVVGNEAKLSDFITDHLKLAKMRCFSEGMLLNILKETKKELFKMNGDTYLKEIASEYDNIPLEDAIQPFVVKNRAVRLVQLRDLTPGRFTNYANPSVDLKFQSIVKTIPANFRLNHKLYQKLMSDEFPEYAQIPYNNTTIPISSEIRMWHEGSRIEYERELLYEQMMETHNRNSSKKIYYTHFYSDFNGYSRYDESWKKLFDRYLLDKNLFIYNKLFEYDAVAKLYQNHISGNANYRKEIISITTLSMFFEIYLSDRS